MSKYENLMNKIKYKDKFILKGGFLIASMIGISSRSTKDIDATIKAYNVTEESILEMLNDICQTNVDDAITFVVQSIKDTRVEDIYNGFREMLLVTFDRIEQHVKIDIYKGDKMTPREIEYKFSSILSKAELTTRMRDYYDIYILYAIYKDQIDTQVLTKALNSTTAHRGTNKIFELKDELMAL
jgi:predicted nucleotidyltransferase component of viral defense system